MENIKALLTNSLILSLLLKSFHLIYYKSKQIKEMATVFTAFHQGIAAVNVESVTVLICEVHVWRKERFSIIL